MKQVCTLLGLLLSSLTSAQLVNGSFESDGNWDFSAWTATCGSPVPLPGAPGFGDFGAGVQHGESNGCGGSFLYQLVPQIHDGETWTLSGWCFNFLFNVSDPYIGFRMGVKHADATFSYNTPALMSSGNWTHLNVTNSFTLVPGDTAYVMCDAGTVSGMGGTNYAVFDGLELTSLSTGVDALGMPTAACFPDPAQERLWVDVPVRPERLNIIDATGREHVLGTFHHNGASLEVDVSSIPPGLCVMRIETATGIRTVRFIKA